MNSESQSDVYEERKRFQIDFVSKRLFCKKKLCICTIGGKTDFEPIN